MAALAGLVLAACGPRMPARRPSDVVITLTRAGGQHTEGLPVSEEMVFAASGESHYKVQYKGGGVVSVCFKTGKADLNELYEALRQAHFDRIQTSTVPGKKRGGTDVTVSWQGITLCVKNSGESFVADGWKDEWEAVIKAIKICKAQQIEKKKIVIPKQFDPRVED